jgi:glycosyltransferase involved in cell wall biosynthesis
MAARGLPIVYRGYVDDAELRQLYVESFALLIPSWHEGFGLPLVEAMSAALPAIASDRGSLPEIGSDAVAYASLADPDAWATVMLEFESNSKRYQAYSEKGLVRSGAFSWDQIAKSVLEFLERL